MKFKITNNAGAQVRVNDTCIPSCGQLVNISDAIKILRTDVGAGTIQKLQDDGVTVVAQASINCTINRTVGDLFP